MCNKNKQLFLLGLVMLAWVTNGAHNVYQEYLFSVHMFGHMALTMGIPLLLVAGAPVTLALRAVRKRDDGTRGGREWILWAIHAPFAKVVTNPFFAAGNFVLSLWLFYYTDLFRWSLYDHLGHEWMIFHFLITGYLFVLSLIGIDPVPYRLPYPFRLLILIGVMAMHAFFGIAIMMNSGLMVAEWFGAMGRTWGATPTGRAKWAARRCSSPRRTATRSARSCSWTRPRPSTRRTVPVDSSASTSSVASAARRWSPSPRRRASTRSSARS